MTPIPHPRRRHNPVAAALITAALVVPLSPPAAAQEGAAKESAAAASDPRALELADRLLDALGGEEAWEAVRFIRFTFAGRRTHHWDRRTGRHRLEYDDEEGRHVVVLGNVMERRGRAWRDGEELAGEEAARLVEGAYAAWINDTYWLLMPYKLRDPGVTLTYDGSEEIDGTAYEKVQLTFEEVGLTPGDRYWAFIHPDTGLMERWEYRLQSYPPGKEPTPWWWQEWQRHGGILLAARRFNPETGRELRLDDLAVPESMPDAVFERP